MPEQKVKTEQWDKQPVPRERWGKDHWSTLLYLESRAVNQRGRIEHEKMRTSRRNRRLAGSVHGVANVMSPDEYPTRLAPVQAERAKFDVIYLTGGHDDWECLQDFADADLLTFEVNEDHPEFPLPVTYALTPAGYQAAAEARKRRAETGKAAI